MAEVTNRVQLTAMGITVDVDRDALDDWDLLETLNTYGGESNKFAFALCNAIFDADTLARVKEALSEGGKLKATKMAEFVGAIAGQLDEVKN